MKNIILTIGGILLAAAIVAGFYLGTLKDAAKNAASKANNSINDITNTTIPFSP